MSKSVSNLNLLSNRLYTPCTCPSDSFAQPTTAVTLLSHGLRWFFYMIFRKIIFQGLLDVFIKIFFYYYKQTNILPENFKESLLCEHKIFLSKKNTELKKFVGLDTTRPLQPVLARVSPLALTWSRRLDFVFCYYVILRSSGK